MSDVVQWLKAPFGQTTLGKFSKSAREGRFGRHLLVHRKTADTPQGAIHRQALDQPPRRIQPPRVRQFEPKNGHFGEVVHAAMRVSRQFSKKSCSGTSLVF
jgi:hypothetical protein